MGRYISDQNKVVVIQESGTYGNTSGIGRWPGEVTDISIDENQGKIEDRFLGNLSRSYGDFADGPIDVTGTVTLNAQDMFFVAKAIGSVGETSDTTNTNTNSVVVTEQNSDVVQNPFISGINRDATIPFSFTLEDSKQAAGTGRNSIRTLRGCVLNTVSLNLTQNEKVTIDVDFMAQNVAYTSGATTAVTARTVPPYLWSDATLQMFGVGINLGSTIQAEDIVFEVNNNMTAPHYINGSRVAAEPFVGNRDYTLTVTSDLDSTTAAVIYDEFHQGGSVFNATLTLDATRVAIGSQSAIITMSGCNLTSMERPSTIEGTNKQTLIIRPKNVDMVTLDDGTNTGSYNLF